MKVELEEARETIYSNILYWLQFEIDDLTKEQMKTKLWNCCTSKNTDKL